MPEANSTPFLSNQVGRNPALAPGATQKQKLLDRRRQPPRSRKYSQSIGSPLLLLAIHSEIDFKKMDDPEADGAFV